MTDANDTAVREVLGQEERRYRAQIEQDASALDDILDDDLVYTHNNGLVDGKKSFMALVQAIHYVKVDRRDVRVKIYGASAVVTGIAKIAVARDGVERQSHLRFVNVWVRRGPQWRNVLWQSTAMPV